MPQGFGRAGGLGNGGPARFPPTSVVMAQDAPWISAPRTGQNENLPTNEGPWEGKSLCIKPDSDDWQCLVDGFR